MMQYLRDNSGEVRTFNSKEQAQMFLFAAGVAPEELRHMIFMENG